MSTLQHIQQEIKSFTQDVSKKAWIESKKDFTLLDSFSLVCYMQSCIEEHLKSITQLEQYQEKLFQIRQSFAQCPRVLLVKIFSYLSLYDQRVAIRSHRLWAEHLNYEIVTHFQSLMVSRPLSFPIMLNEKYKIYIDSSYFIPRCSIAINNHHAILVNAPYNHGTKCYSYSLQNQKLSKEWKLSTTNLKQITKIIQLNQKNKLLYLTNSTNVGDEVSEGKTISRGWNTIEVQLKKKGKSLFVTNEEIHWKLAGITDEGKKVSFIDYPFPDPMTEFTYQLALKGIHICSPKVRGNFVAGMLLYWYRQEETSAKGPKYFFLWNSKKNLIHIWDCSSWSLIQQTDQYTFNSNMIIWWENDTMEQSSVYLFQGRSFQKISIFPFEILSLDINELNQLCIVSCQKHDLYLHVYQVGFET